jgi:hypothetical protein
MLERQGRRGLVTRGAQWTWLAALGRLVSRAVARRRLGCIESQIVHGRYGVACFYP